MTILDQIVAQKRIEVAERKKRISVRSLEQSPHFARVPVSLSAHLCQPDASGIIAEFKRQSPSKGVFHANISAADTTAGYARAGASALSVLTDAPYFGGSDADLTDARRVNACPIIRKDFTVDEFQVLEAKALGADAILLIAAVLSPGEVAALATLARSLGLETLLEVHNATELARSLSPSVTLVGVNNRDLRDFSVSVENSAELAELIPGEFVKVSESGLRDAATIHRLRAVGYRGFLIGETFMRQPDPAAACAALVASLRLGL